MGPLIPALIFGGVATMAMASRRAQQPSQAPLQLPPPPPAAWPTGPRQLTGPVSMDLGPMPETQQPQKLASLLEQPLPIAVDAARHRFGRNKSVLGVEQGEGEIVVELDPLGTDAVLIPPTYLGWPIRMVQ